ncbi:MAG TPA: RING finger protein [Polyangia bacterium]
MDDLKTEVPTDTVLRCATCGTRIQKADLTHACPDCAQSYHQACWDEVGGCATFGCAQAPVASKPPTPSMVGGGWGDFKICPACHSRIGASLLVCSCRATFPWAAPMTPEQYQQWTEDMQSAKRLKLIVTVLFVLSLTGVLAPILGLASFILTRRGRKLLEGADGAFTALAWGNMIIGATYTVLFVLLAVGR